MRKALLIIFCVLLMLSGCAPKTAEDGIVRLPWPSHAPEATPYVRVPEQSETPPTPQAEFYDSWEEMLASMYVAENNFWFNDWELEMFKALREGTTVVTPKWLTFDAPNLTGTVVALPAREDVDFEPQMQMIVEFYSR